MQPDLDPRLRLIAIPANYGQFHGPRLELLTAIFNAVGKEARLIRCEFDILKAHSFLLIHSPEFSPVPDLVSIPILRIQTENASGSIVATVTDPETGKVYVATPLVSLQTATR